MFPTVAMGSIGTWTTGELRHGKTHTESRRESRGKGKSSLVNVAGHRLRGEGFLSAQ